MNIFVLHPNPVMAARYHCDKHVVKMILETAQILSTVHHLHDSERPGMYRRTHAGHPCTVWAGECTGNYSWLVKLGRSLAREYTHRYGKQHKSAAVIESLAQPPRGMSRQPLQPFVQCMPDQYKRGDPCLAYRDYYLGDKWRILRYTKRNTPAFIRNHT